MAKMREPAPPPPPRLDGPVPRELSVGALADVWDVAGGSDLIATFRNYASAVRRWQADAGLDVATACALLPPRAPWRLTDHDGPARLARNGATVDQIPHLRAAALARVAALPDPNRRNQR